MVQTRVDPHLEQVAEEAQHVEQRRLYGRNQSFSPAILVAARCVCWLCDGNPQWMFPAGWWCR